MTRTVKLLGSLAITENGRSSLLRKNAKGCALLIYLIVTQKSHSREHIADLLWEARSTSQSLRNLRVLLTRIRPLLPELQISRQELAFHPEPETKIDFVRLVEALTTSESDHLAAALPLYDGALLAGFHIENAPRFNEWLLLERERLQHRVIKAYHRLCNVFADEQAWESGLTMARRWLLLDDLDERAYRKCIKFLAAMGEKTAALQQYETCRQRLWQELDVEPTAETTALAQKIMATQETAVTATFLETPDLSQLPLNELPDPGPLPQNSVVPLRRNGDFTGREEKLRAIASHLRTPTASSPPVIAVTGMGGLGKTQLAVEFCYRYGRYFSGGVYWMSFADANNIAAELSIIGGQRGMGLYREADQLTLADRVDQVKRAWQEPIPRLLIFDNCEKEMLLSKWLPVTGGCRVLLTSQRGIWSPELGVTQLPLPVLHRAESVTLLQKLVPHLNKTVAKAIAKEVDNLPLALHLAGSFLRRYQQISPSRYLAQLQSQSSLQHPSLQGHGTQHSPTAHKLHVARTFEINLAQLDPDDEVDRVARQLLARAACFAPGELIPRTLLLTTVLREHEGIMAELLANDGVNRLVTLGFLAQQGHTHLSMHRLLVTFTQQTVRELDNAQADVEKSLIKALDEQRFGYWQLATLPFSPNHILHIMHAALAHATSQAAQLVTLWGCHLRDVGLFTEAEQFLCQALRIHEQTVGQHHLDTAQSLGLLGNLYLRMGNMQLAQTYCEQSVAIIENLPQNCSPQLAQGLYQLGTIKMAQSWFEQGELYLTKALAIWKQIYGYDPIEMSKQRLNLGVLYMRRGDYKKAHTIFERILATVEEHIDSQHQFMAIVLTYLADICFFLGDEERAFTLMKRALSIHEETAGATHLTTAYSLNDWGWLLVMKGDLAEAQPYLERALEIRQRVIGQYHRATANTLQHLGDLFLKRGEPAMAKSYLDQTLAIRQQILRPEHVEIAFSFLSLGELCLVTAKGQEACAFFEQAWSILEKTVLPTHYAYQQVREYLDLI
ncbi:hypothetical protein MNBD_CHLOROFLEXI01-4938 [hydrothermal vent metagenome]|uniref:Bacterial transcriptional activator domain-containing protein n=1 Tax=hydrothermal vent metagenome TaxID=652676 RepID=A0A3B0VMN5_9ZZZZ